MLYYIRHAKYEPERWSEEFIGFIFTNPDATYALCIKDCELGGLGFNKVYYKANTWYSW